VGEEVGRKKETKRKGIANSKLFEEASLIDLGFLISYFLDQVWNRTNIEITRGKPPKFKSTHSFTYYLINRLHINLWEEENMLLLVLLSTLESMH